ncbi:MAG: serine--tRNA ligase [Candidatus Pacebacteria bacterium]|nr:serine--tRNA ligase [Candidatus Paceibacterota bacterium]
MLDINYIQQNPDKIKWACQVKQLDPAVVDQLLIVDQKRRQLKQQIDQVRQQVNENAEEIKQQVHQGQKPDPELIKKGRQIKDQLKQVEPEFRQVKEEFDQLMLQIPNVPAAEVPLGQDESGNVVVRQVGQVPEFDFKPLPHDQLMKNLDWVDIERGVKIAGFRSYFLKNKAVVLEQALLRYALDFMIKQDFTPMTVPILVNEEPLVGTGYFPWGQDDHYYTQEGQILTGTAEVALTSYYMNETLREDDLPIKLAGVSPCFRKEVGAHGKDTQGVIRVHQFNKVEQVVLTVADEKKTQEWHEKMLGFSEKLLQNLELPYQVLMMCTGDMGAGQRKKYDLETWFPAQNKYRETHSASYFNDFQTRRLGIKYQAKDGSTKYAYSLNNTVAATPRLLAAIIENYQQPDGSVKIPAVLEPYMSC